MKTASIRYQDGRTGEMEYNDISGWERGISEGGESYVEEIEDSRLLDLLQADDWETLKSEYGIERA